MIEKLPQLVGMVGRLTPVTLFGIAVGSAGILFVPADTAKTFGLNDFRDTYRSTLGFSFFGSSGLLAAYSVWWCARKVVQILHARRERRIREQHLRELTPLEKAYIVPYILKDTPSQRFAFGDGVAEVLVGKAILHRPAKYAVSRAGVPHGIQPWARRFLKAHLELLEGAKGEPADLRRSWDDL